MPACSTSITETPISYPSSTSDLFDIISIPFEDIPVWDTSSESLQRFPFF